MAYLLKNMAVRVLAVSFMIETIANDVLFLNHNELVTTNELAVTAAMCGAVLHVACTEKFNEPKIWHYVICASHILVLALALNCTATYKLLTCTVDSRHYKQFRSNLIWISEFVRIMK